MKQISIARDFSTTPGGRTNEDGPNNGRRFRERFLEEAVKQHDSLVIDLDGVAGLPGSFCDAAFGAIVREHHLTKDQFDLLFKFTGTDDDFQVNKGMIYLNVDRAISELG
jgi:hypothetical protein